MIIDIIYKTYSVSAVFGTKLNAKLILMFEILSWDILDSCSMPLDEISLSELKNNLKNCHDIFYRHSWSPEEESYTDFGDPLTLLLAPTCGSHLWFKVQDFK